MCEGQGIQTPSLAPRTAPSRFKSGTFYFAEKRKFLFCVDLAMLFLHEGSRPRLVGYQHPSALVAATGLLDTTFAAIRLLKSTLKSWNFGRRAAWE
jgi:hypothetical protein